ncbi:hypothetical protein ABE65_012085 [Fictibacillus phosphorivorans]|uniref:Uncharacterized protein n=1 Tax=Fictibacillus phosphorivorans TaxID=1221500 RepID=A0A160INC0_9BACL|nr:hypothetical protein [Fictibacillus phosphorivorans]ANC77496.1 hypothetical protein ABE65_012085 [Fictibacillus phosphorivorans]
MKKRTRGEERFVSNVLEAVIRNDTKLLHGLFLIHGQHHYISFENESFIQNHPIVKDTHCICLVGGDVINYLHIKTGDHDLSRLYVRRSLSQLVHGAEKLAQEAFEEYENEYIRNFIKLINKQNTIPSYLEQLIVKIETHLIVDNPHFVDT